MRFILYPERAGEPAFRAGELGCPARNDRARAVLDNNDGVGASPDQTQGGMRREGWGLHR
jgi:hypothetical protein